MLRFVELYGKGDLYSYNCWFKFDRNISKYVFEHCVSITKTYKGRKKSLDVYNSEAESIEPDTDKQRGAFSFRNEQLFELSSLFIPIRIRQSHVGRIFGIQFP